VRGITDTQLRDVQVPVAVMASEPENRVHSHQTVERLLESITGAIRINEEFPESRPDFIGRLDAFVAVRDAQSYGESFLPPAAPV
jgi:hypothetical protein